jgi:ribosomal protein S18 acetylase RimI-like enzyme
MMNRKTTIRVMTIDDYENVYGLWNTTAGMGMRSLDDSEAGIRTFLERNPRTCFIALTEVDGKAEITGVILSGHDGRRGFIYHTAVKAEYRGQGIGVALAAAAEAALRDEGINKVALVAFRTNETGNRFWEQRGYSERTDLVYRNKSLNPDNQ